jgi:signal transduction histidine kinase
LSLKDWYFIGFVLTVIAACVLWGLAVAVFRSNRRGYMQRMLALAMVFLGLWLLSGFAEKVLPTPNNTFTLWTFRWAYVTGEMAAVFFVLFGASLFLDRAPSRPVRLAVLLTGICAAGLCLTPLVIRSASYHADLLTSKTGPLFPLVELVTIGSCVGGIYLITRKWMHSTGIDRARTSIVLFGVVIFVPIGIVSVFVLPAIIGNDVSSNFAFVAGLIPAVFTSYAIIRLRLLDTRIILRRSGVLLIGTALLTLPLIALFALIESMHLNPVAGYSAILIVFLLGVFFSHDAWRSLQKLSARFFFSELYDENELLGQVSSRLAAHSDPNKGLLAALSEIVAPLGLESVSIVIPPGTIDEKCWDLECAAAGDSTLRKQVNDDCHFMPWLNAVDRTLVTEELQRWPAGDEEERLGRSLAESRLSACLPITASNERVGYLLIGAKVAGRALTATDISLLEKSTEHIGLYIDNYSLSTRLAVQLEEMRKVYRELNESYAFKSEIINVASHEFRTPVTVIDTCTQMLAPMLKDLTEPEGLECVDNIERSSRRLMDLVNKFLHISMLEASQHSVVKSTTTFGRIVRDLCADLRDADLERLVIEGDQERYIMTEPNHLVIMLANLVENALRFSPEESNVFLKFWSDDEVDYIRVQDFGKGIPQEEVDRAFEPFVRLESLWSHTQGMGLGLHIVRLISTRLGVGVSINRGPLGGTLVTLTLN